MMLPAKLMIMEVLMTETSMFYMLSDCQQSTILQTTITQLTITYYLIFISFFCKNSNCSDAALSIQCWLSTQLCWRPEDDNISESNQLLMFRVCLFHISKNQNKLMMFILWFTLFFEIILVEFFEIFFGCIKTY